MDHDALHRAPSWAWVDLSALNHNLGQVAACADGRKILAVVKADAYGHGAVAVAQFLDQRAITRPDLLCVAFLDEAITLREAGIGLPILLMTGCPPDQVATVAHYRLTPMVLDRPSLEALGHHAVSCGEAIGIHIKIDTGMGRLGVPQSDAAAFLRDAVRTPGIRVEGICSHLADADDAVFSARQVDDFQDTLSALRAAGVVTPPAHMAGSGAILHLDFARLDQVRPGLMLYGYCPGKGAPQVPLRPVMQVSARVLSVKTHPAGTAISYGRTHVTRRESRIATVAIGYADGYPRALSNKGIMIAGGRRVPVVGRVCMDMTMIDVTDVPGVCVGDAVTVMGAEGGAAIWADELATLCDTIPYEILCGMGSRVHRIYASRQGASVVRGRVERGGV